QQQKISPNTLLSSQTTRLSERAVIPRLKAAECQCGQMKTPGIALRILLDSAGLSLPPAWPGLCDVDKVTRGETGSQIRWSEAFLARFKINTHGRCGASQPLI
ncbi:hypothetical protein, partial [Mycolicibacter arupensis]